MPEARARHVGAQPEIEVGAQTVARVEAAEAPHEPAAEEHALLHQRADALLEQRGNPFRPALDRDLRDDAVAVVDQVDVAVHHRLRKLREDLVEEDGAEARQQRVVVVDVGEPVPLRARGGEPGVERAVDAAGAAGVGHDAGLRKAGLQRGHLRGGRGENVEQVERLAGDRRDGAVEKRGFAEGRRHHEDAWMGAVHGCEGSGVTLRMVTATAVAS